jgi:hypothetical protein
MPGAPGRGLDRLDRRTGPVVSTGSTDGGWWWCRDGRRRPTSTTGPAVPAVEEARQRRHETRWWYRGLGRGLDGLDRRRLVVVS